MTNVNQLFQCIMIFKTSLRIEKMCKSVLASWNFKHIVNLERIRGYNSINFREGYQMTEIRMTIIN